MATSCSSTNRCGPRSSRCRNASPGRRRRCSRCWLPSPAGAAVPVLALLAAAAVAAVYWFTWELLQSRVASTVAAIVAALSPFVWVQSGTLLGYHFAFVTISAAAAALLAAVRSTKLAVVAGVLC